MLSDASMSRVESWLRSLLSRSLIEDFCEINVPLVAIVRHLHKNC